MERERESKKERKIISKKKRTTVIVLVSNNSNGDSRSECDYFDSNLTLLANSDTKKMSVRPVHLFSTPSALGECD
jgi:hypothetical protein